MYPWHSLSQGYSNYLWYYSAGNHRWEYVPNGGKSAPMGRFGHSTALIENTLFVFNGFGVPAEETVWFDLMLCLIMFMLQNPGNNRMSAL